MHYIIFLLESTFELMLFILEMFLEQDMKFYRMFYFKNSTNNSNMNLRLIKGKAKTLNDHYQYMYECFYTLDNLLFLWIGF